MPVEHTLLLSVAIFVVAVLYSSVGHAGASGYIGVMSLFRLTPVFIKPVALILNMVVATIGTWQFYRAGHFSWRLFWPFALLGVPYAYLGGWLNLPSHVFKIIVGIVLLFSGWRFIFQPPVDEPLGEPARPVALGIGAGLGLLSRLTGTGGGIFFTPLLLFMRWTTAKIAAGVSALFILVNSLAGLLGNFSSTQSIPPLTLPLVGSALAGGIIGSQLGSRHLPHTVIKRCLAAVLLMAGLKLIFARWCSLLFFSCWWVWCWLGSAARCLWMVRRESITSPAAVPGRRHPWPRPWASHWRSLPSGRP